MRNHGQFEITEQTIPWIMANVKTSMYNEERSYIYNKAYYEAFIAEPALEITKGNVFDDIRSWATDKGIYDKGDARTQYLKLMEEAGELAEALLKNDKPEIQDAIKQVSLLKLYLKTISQKYKMLLVI